MTLHAEPTAPHLTLDDLTSRLQQAGVLTPAVLDALDLAQQVHGQQQRDDGTPYLEEHIYPVMHDVCAWALGSAGAQVATAVTIAALHDTLEDGDGLEWQDLAQRFGPEVGAAVRSLTKPPKTGTDAASKLERERTYFAGLRQGPRLAQVVKLFDRVNNLSCLHKTSAEKRSGYLEETREYHLPLAESLDPALAGRMRALVERLAAMP